MKTTWEEKKRKTQEDMERYLGGGPGVRTKVLAVRERTGAEPRRLEAAGHRPMHLQGVTGICMYVILCMYVSFAQLVGCGSFHVNSTNGPA